MYSGALRHKRREPPQLVHHREDEDFYIIEGALTITVGEKTYKAKNGDYFLGPKGIPHTHTVDSPGYARILMICSTAGFEDCVHAMNTPAESLVPHEPENVETDFGKIMNLASEFGVEFL